MTKRASPVFISHWGISHSLVIWIQSFVISYTHSRRQLGRAHHGRGHRAAGDAELDGELVGGAGDRRAERLDAVGDLRRPGREGRVDELTLAGGPDDHE